MSASGAAWPSSPSAVSAASSRPGDVDRQQAAGTRLVGDGERERVAQTQRAADLVQRVDRIGRDHGHGPRVRT